MEIPNNTRHEELMDIHKFAYTKNLMHSDKKIWINGTFKDKVTGEITSGDNFKAIEIWENGKKLDAELIYKTYLEWFNRTLRPFENEREFVSASFEKNLEELGI